MQPLTTVLHEFNPKMRHHKYMHADFPYKHLRSWDFSSQTMAQGANQAASPAVLAILAVVSAFVGVD
jgi:hypothetical protein